MSRYRRSGGVFEGLFAGLVRGYFWLMIFLSPVIIGVVLGAICWFEIGGVGKVLGVALAVGGVAIGWTLADGVGHGAGHGAGLGASVVAFMSRVSASPELDRPHLMRNLGSEDPAVVRKALDDLAWLGRAPRELEPVLETLLEHPDQEIVGRAEAALRQLRGE